METARRLNGSLGEGTSCEQSPPCLEEGAVTVSSGGGKGKECTHPQESGRDGMVSFYLDQLRALSPLSAKEERELCQAIKKGERAVIKLIGQWCYWWTVCLCHSAGVRVVSLQNCHPSYKTRRLGDTNRKRGVNKNLLLFEKINALTGKQERLRPSRKNTPTNPTCEVLHEGAEKRAAEIAKLIAQVKLNDREIERMLAEVEQRTAAENIHHTTRRQTKHTLKDILVSMREQMLAIKQKKEALVESHLPLTIHIAKKYRHRGVDFLDLIQEGNQGLMRAVDTFDYRRGNRFTSYAMWWVRQSIIRAIYNQSRTMRIPVYLFDRLNHYLTASEQLHQEKGRKPTLKEVAGHMKVSMDSLVEMTDAFKTTQSLEEYHSSGTGSSSGSAREGLCSKMILQTDLKSKVTSVLSQLSFRESEIIKLRFGINGSHYEHSLQEIGRRFNLTRERIRQIEKSALRKLKRMHSVQELREFLI